MKTKCAFVAVFTILAFTTFSESNAQFFRRAIRPAQTSANFYSTSPAVNTTRIVSTTPVVQTMQVQQGVIQKKNKETKLRHVYRPIKGGQTMVGADGRTLILANYIGTHYAVANEESLGEFSDSTNGSMKQKFVKNAASGQPMWKEKVLDGTLRWVPKINDGSTGNKRVEGETVVQNN